MNAGRIANATARLGVVLLLAALAGCSLAGSRTRWNPPAPPPLVATPGAGLAAAQAHFAAGEQAEACCNPACIDHYFAAAAAAWPCHVVGATAPGGQGSELYRASVRQMIGAAGKFGRLQPQSGIVLASGQVLPMTYRGFLWQPDEFCTFLPVGSYESRELTRHYRSCGVGVEYVVLTSQASRRPFIRGSQPFAATAVLQPTAGMMSSGYTLAFYDPLHVAATDAGLPLARDLTAPLAYAATQEGDAWIEGFLQPELDPALEGLRMSQPFQPGKIPVVFVHGLASSPVTWSNLENELRANPAIMNRYQVWVFRYDTGDPFLGSAARLRMNLAEVRQVYDPCRADPSLSRMVLVGHSLGGLVSKLQVTYSGDEMWNSAAKQPLATIHTDSATRADLTRAFYFGPSPDVSRVVYIATPHMGSIYATRCIGRVSSALVRERPQWRARHEQLVRDNPCAFRKELEEGIPTSVDLLEPTSCILLATAQLPYRHGVRLHSIIGDDRWTLSEGRSDGVVAVSSARLIGVESEIFVDASHTEIQRRPETTCEVTRILLAHAAEGACPLPMIGTLARGANEGKPTTPSLARRTVD